MRGRLCRIFWLAVIVKFFLCIVFAYDYNVIIRTAALRGGNFLPDIKRIYF